MPQMLDDDFDDGEKTEGTGQHSGEGHQAKRENGNVDQHADPKPHERIAVVGIGALGHLGI